MWAFVLGWLVGSRTARNAALPDSVRQERYDADVERRAEAKQRRVPFWRAISLPILLVLLIGPVLGPVLLVTNKSAGYGVDTITKVNCGSVVNPQRVGGPDPEWARRVCQDELTLWGVSGGVLFGLGLFVWAFLGWGFASYQREFRAT